MKKYLFPKEVEAIYGIPVKTLANWRCKGRGPAYYKYGARIRYSIMDLDHWVQQHRTMTLDMPKPVDRAKVN